MARNSHRVSKKQWKKWNKDEQAMFNRLWYFLSPPILPTGVGMSRTQFNVLRWNVCWMATECMKNWRGNWGFERKEAARGENKD